MGNCKICGKPKSKYHMGNKLVCLRCDELLFDLEIECEEEAVAAKKATAAPVKSVVLKKPMAVTKK